MITFIVVPLVAGFCTLLFSKLDVMIRGSRAREPIFMGTQPEEYSNYRLKKQETADKRVDDREEEVEEFDADDGTDEEDVKVSSDNLMVDKTDAAEGSQPAQVAA